MKTKYLIERELERLGISQKEMASILGVSPVYVHQILHGKKKAEIRLFEFAEKLGIDLFQDAFGHNWSDEVKRACEDLAEILMSGNEFVKNAILSNIEVFKHTVRQAEEIEKIKHDLREMRRRELPGASGSLGDPGLSMKKKVI